MVGDRYSVNTYQIPVRRSGVLGVLGFHKNQTRYETITNYDHEPVMWQGLAIPGYYPAQVVSDMVTEVSLPHASNCRNCGAIVSMTRCEYCGTHY